jgi:hypothetical protein
MLCHTQDPRRIRTDFVDPFYKSLTKLLARFNSNDGSYVIGNNGVHGEYDAPDTGS